MNIYIDTGDNHRIKIPENLFYESEHLKFMSELFENEEDEDVIIKLPNISKDDIDNTILAYNKTIIFDQMEFNDVIRVLNTSNFLNIHSLFTKAVEQIRNIIRNNSTDQLRILFHEQNDFTKEEEEEMYKKDSWCKKWSCHDTSGLLTKL